METTQRITFNKVTSAIGAVVEGIDLRTELNDDTVRVLRKALGEDGVLFFRGQDISSEQMEAFAARFGRPAHAPFVDTEEQRERSPVGESDMQPQKHSTAVWHADSTFAETPPMATCLRAVRPPAFGGDTCWSSMYAAYEGLSAPMRQMLDGLTAIHSTAPVIARMGEAGRQWGDGSRGRFGSEYAHPVVRVHPETGRKGLYVNQGWTTSIVELTAAESDRLLGLLFEHVKTPEFTVRWHWSANDLALWDNRCVQHYAVPDYTAERIMARVVIAGDRPVGPE